MRGDSKFSYLITGGAGFIGSNFINYLFNKYAGNAHIVNLDMLTYAGNLSNLKRFEKYPGYNFIKGDIAGYIENIFKEYSFDFIINFAAESHVDRSINDAAPFIKTNIAGVQNLIDYSRRFKIKKFLQVSTDEVYGSLGKTGYFSESTPLAPNSPYSASKASADLLVRAAYKTHEMPGVITRCSNNYGPYQFPEKLIPLIISNIVSKKELPVYGRGENIRDWIFVEDHCRAIDLALHEGTPGEVYNVGGNNEYKNIDIIHLIADLMEKRGYPDGRKLIKFIEDRPGHDFRYAIDASKIKKELGFEIKIPFETGINKTIDWYLENRDWLENITSGEYSGYYTKFYEKKIKGGSNGAIRNN